MREQRLSPVWVTWGDVECSFALCNICPVAPRWQKRIGSFGGSGGPSPSPLALQSSSISPAPNSSRTALPTLPPSQLSPSTQPPSHTSSSQHCPFLHCLSLSSFPRPILPHLLHFFFSSPPSRAALQSLFSALCHLCTPPSLSAAWGHIVPSGKQSPLRTYCLSHRPPHSLQRLPTAVCCRSTTAGWTSFLPAAHTEASLHLWVASRSPSPPLQAAAVAVLPLTATRAAFRNPQAVFRAWTPWSCSSALAG